MVNHIHDDVDLRAARLARVHAARMVCRRGCSACCVDGLTVLEIEADRIREAAPALLESGTPAPEGGCAFLGPEGECRVYEARPYVCRTQGLPLRWVVEEAEAEYRDICPLNDEGDPIEELPAEDCWTLGETEARLMELQEQRYGSLRRVPLRELFRRRDHQGTE